MYISYSKRNQLLVLFLVATIVSIVTIWLPIPETAKGYLDLLIKDAGRATIYALLLILSCLMWIFYIIFALKPYLDELKNFGDRYRNNYYGYDETIELQLLHHVLIFLGAILGIVLVVLMLKSLAAALFIFIAILGVIHFFFGK